MHKVVSQHVHVAARQTIVNAMLPTHVHCAAHFAKLYRQHHAPNACLLPCYRHHIVETCS